MPGRVSARSTRSSAATVSRKSSTQTLKSRGSASARASAYAVEIPDEGDDSDLRTRICKVFGETQKTTATQRKLVVNLRKIQEACCYEQPDAKKRVVEFDFDESEFNEEMTRCVKRVLGVKKSEPVGDRVIRFLGVFLKHATEKDNALWRPEGEDETTFPETPTSRLTAHLLAEVLVYLDRKEKTVRFRATQTVAHIVNSLDQIDDELFDRIRIGLAKRLRDKEPSIRVQAVLGLGRLAGNDDEEEDEDSDDDAAGGILLKLLDILQHDPSADVRRAVLMNLNFSQTSLPLLLERARDLDPATRRALYGKLLPALGDFRSMGLIQRAKLLRWGLRDRDELVRKATGRLFSTRWIEDCAATQEDRDPEHETQPGEVAPPNMGALLELLERIDIINSGQDEGMAHDAMREFWDSRPDYREFVTFDDDFWNDLTPESAFVLRSFNDYCQASDDNRVQDLLEKLPEVIKVAYFIQVHLNSLTGQIHQAALLEEPDPELEEDVAGCEFVVEQLLHIANTLDFTDEIGRQQIFKLMRDSLAQPQLPEECTKLAIDVLRATCGSREAGEREFCRVILEAIAEVRDTINDAAEDNENLDESFHSAQSEISDSTAGEKPRTKKSGKEEDPEVEAERHVRQIMVYLKCLHIAQCMLQNVHLETDLEANVSLRTMLNTLIVPAVRNPEKLVRERGLVCLGLCALLSKNLANSNMQLFMACYTQGHDNLQLSALQILSDIIITYPSLLAPPAPEADQTEGDTEMVNEFLKPLTKIFLKAFNHPEPLFSLTACTAASKLLLLSILPQPQAMDLLKAFVMAYFNPDKATKEWDAVRQALSYFLPVFCHSKQQNALLMSQIAIPVIQKLLVLREDPDEDQGEEMVGWPVVAGHLAEWTDGRRVVGASEVGIDGKVEMKGDAEEPHIYLAIELLERALSNSCSKDERKPLLVLLSKLHISASAIAKQEAVDQETLRALHALATEAVEAKLGPDAASRNAIAKLEIALTKRLGDVEHVTQIPDDDGSGEQTELPDEALTRAAGYEGEEGVDEDTVLAGMHAEGTRLQLDDDDDDGEELEEADDTTILPVRRGAKVIETEDDIIESLLDSEI